MRALIADDEPLLRHHLSKLLGEVTSDIEVVASVSDGLQAVEKIKELQPDVVFLDIRMPGLDGLAVAGAMKELGTFPHVVFVTAYDNYAIEAFEKGAIDYLVKPIDEGRLQKTCERLVNQHKDHDQRDELLKLLESTNDNKAPPFYG